MGKALGRGGEGGAFTLWQGLSVPAGLETRYGRTDFVSEVTFHSLLCRMGLPSHLLRGMCSCLEWSIPRVLL